MSDASPFPAESFVTTLMAFFFGLGKSPSDAERVNEEAMKNRRNSSGFGFMFQFLFFSDNCLESLVRLINICLLPLRRNYAAWVLRFMAASNKWSNSVVIGGGGGVVSDDDDGDDATFLKK